MTQLTSKLTYQKRVQIVGRDRGLTVGTFSNEIFLDERLHLVGDIEVREMPHVRKVRAETVQRFWRKISSQHLLNEEDRVIAGILCYAHSNVRQNLLQTMYIIKTNSVLSRRRSCLVIHFLFHLSSCT